MLRLLLAAIVSSAFAVACSSSDPAQCNDRGSLSGSEACRRLKEAVDEKCGATGRSFDCDVYLANSKCKSSDSFCGEGVDKGVADVRSAVDCNAVGDVRIALVCFE